MTSEPTPVVDELTRKLARVDELEKEIAPSGVGFFIRGQERISDARQITPIEDKLRAADIAIEVLESRKEIIAELEEEGLL